jgi:flavine halogenase
VTVIQGTADAANNKLSQEELNKTLEFCAHAFEPVQSEEDRAIAMEKVNGTHGMNGHTNGDAKMNGGINGTGYNPDLSQEQLRAVKHIRARQMMRTEDTMHNENFGTDAIGGYRPNLKRGSLGLVRQEANGVNGHA